MRSSPPWRGATSPSLRPSSSWRSRARLTSTLSAMSGTPPASAATAFGGTTRHLTSPASTTGRRYGRPSCAHERGAPRTAPGGHSERTPSTCACARTGASTRTAAGRGQSTRTATPTSPSWTRARRCRWTRRCAASSTTSGGSFEAWPSRVQTTTGTSRSSASAGTLTSTSRRRRALPRVSSSGCSASRSRTGRAKSGLPSPTRPCPPCIAAELCACW
mmetsp:Transcript_53788/g.162722  ORF Transcript_53788/g.162722 Transcript_53788/m.162722 type:complete len:218 (-) Transcript_53788:97-750(-)